jgi:hypothetical protein
MRQGTLVPDIAEVDSVILRGVAGVIEMRLKMFFPGKFQMEEREHSGSLPMIQQGISILLICGCPLSSCVLVLSSAALVGWWLYIPQLTSAFAHYATVKPKQQFVSSSWLLRLVAGKNRGFSELPGASSHRLNSARQFF